MAGLNSQALIDALTTHAMTTGYFRHVNQHEPRSELLGDLNAAIWVQTIAPTQRSGLNITSASVIMNLRIYSNINKAQNNRMADQIDPEIMSAVDALMAAYAGDFTLGGLVRNVDLIGGDAAGQGLRAEAGYLQVGDTLFRVMTITIPMVVNDAWNQVA